MSEVCNFAMCWTRRITLLLSPPPLPPSLPPPSLSPIATTENVLSTRRKLHSSFSISFFVPIPQQFAPFLLSIFPRFWVILSFFFQLPRFFPSSPCSLRHSSAIALPQVGQVVPTIFFRWKKKKNTKSKFNLFNRMIKEHVWMRSLSERHFSLAVRLFQNFV